MVLRSSELALRANWALLALLAAACTSASAGSGADAASLVSCEHDPRIAVYTAGIEAKSPDGSVHIRLLASDPSPPARGTNTWTIRILGSDGKDLTGATIDVKPFMPDHGHGPSALPVASANADGSWSVANLDLFMPGVWRVTFTVHGPSGDRDVVFFFCIEG